jgi:hypothetical protein
MKGGEIMDELSLKLMRELLWIADSAVIKAQNYYRHGIIGDDLSQGFIKTLQEIKNLLSTIHIEIQNS